MGLCHLFDAKPSRGGFPAGPTEEASRLNRLRKQLNAIASKSEGES